jgi:hypothetical protein
MARRYRRRQLAALRGTEHPELASAGRVGDR